jgi:ribosomal protein S18 acetylase RimI-like enzyme
MTTKKHGNSKIIYKFDVVPAAQQVIELYNDADLPRPTHDSQRIRAMFENSNLIVTAWDGDKLVGVSRTVTDWVWCSYLADLAVSPDYKKSGIGKNLSSLRGKELGNNRCSYYFQSLRRWITTQR